MKDTARECGQAAATQPGTSLLSRGGLRASPIERTAWAVERVKHVWETRHEHRTAPRKYNAQRG